MTERFSWVRPATDTFIGRTKLLTDTYARLRRGESIAFRAARRMGKTSLLLRVRNELSAVADFCDSGFVPCWIDAREVTKVSAAAFCSELEARLVDQLRARTGLEIDSLAGGAAAIRQRAPCVPLVLIDELDAIARVPDYEDALDWLNTRAFGAGDPMFQFLVAGSFGLWELLSDESTSPLGTRTTWMVLGALELDAPAAAVGHGYKVPVLYQYYSQHRLTDASPEGRFAELLAQFGNDGVGVASSWWRSMGSTAREFLTSWASSRERARPPRDRETLDRLFGTGLTAQRNEAKLEPGQLCRSLATSDVVQPRAQSTFISYGYPDRAFATKLNQALKHHNINTFFFEDDAPPGAKLHRLMNQGVNACDRVILVCSQASLERNGLLNELEATLAREARDGGAEYLIPIRLDEHVFSWAPARSDLAQTVRDRVIADFSQYHDGASFEAQLRRLVSALQT